MSLILTLDSSTDACSVALNDNGRITSLFENAAKSHTRRLLPMVDEIMSGSGYSLADLDAIAFGRGPGSFTGLRICLGVVQGLAFGANLPVIPVSTLESMAAGWFNKPGNSREQSLLVALDARMNEVYWSLYRYQSDQVEPVFLTEEYVMTPADVVLHPEVVRHMPQLGGVGPGWHYPELAALAVTNVAMNVLPDAADMARLAAEKFRRGEYLSVLDAEPVYLRNEVSWQKRQRIRSESSEIFE